MGLENDIANSTFEDRPAWAGGAVGPGDMAFLAELLIECRPRKVVEIGVASGLSSVLALRVLSAIGVKACLFGVDTQERFFLDPAFKTGQLVSDMCPEEEERFELIVAPSSAHAMHRIGAGIDFAFVDANHLHPWPAFDLLSLVPFLNDGAWVAFHDINLSLVPRHKHRNRGAKYVYEHWYGEKRHSSDPIPMVGAIRFDATQASYMERIVDVLFTPPEVRVPVSCAKALAALYGERDAVKREVLAALADRQPATGEARAPDLSAPALLDREKATAIGALPYEVVIAESTLGRIRTGQEFHVRGSIRNYGEVEIPTSLPGTILEVGGELYEQGSKRKIGAARWQFEKESVLPDEFQEFVLTFNAVSLKKGPVLLKVGLLYRNVLWFSQYDAAPTVVSLEVEPPQ